MTEKFELTPKQQKETASRVLSDAELIKKGAKYSKEGVLELTKKQVKEIEAESKMSKPELKIRKMIKEQNIEEDDDIIVYLLNAKEFTDYIPGLQTSVKEKKNYRKGLFGGIDYDDEKKPYLFVVDKQYRGQSARSGDNIYLDEIKEIESTN